jgi:hypothetical protein
MARAGVEQCGVTQITQPSTSHFQQQVFGVAMRT